VGPDGAIYIGSYDKKLYAVNPNGTLKWSFATSNGVFSSPAIGADGAVYFGSHDGKVRALNPDGTLRWTFTTGGAVYSSPAIDKDQVVYVGSFDQKLHAINPNGTQKWVIQESDWIYSSPAVTWSPDINPINGALYFGSYSGNFHRREASEGGLNWTFQTEGPIVSSPALDIEGNVYVGSEDGKLYSLSPDGTLRWTFQAGDYIYSSPAIGWDGRVYFGAYDRKLYVLGTNGALHTSFLLGGDIYSSPVVASDGRVYVGCLDGKLYAFPAETLLAPSAWPMFRNDSRHHSNEGLLWFEGGGFLPGGWFQFNLRSSIFSDDQYEVRVGFEWSDNLIDWHFAGYVSVQYEGFKTLAVGPTSYETLFFRAKSFSAAFPRSRNPYGFIKLTLPPGWSMIANPLNTRLNTLNGLMPDVPEGTQFLKWNEAEQTYESFYFDPADGWLPDTPLLPGEGGFVFNPEAGPITVTFIGEVLQGYLSNSIPAGVSIRSSMVPQSGGITSLLGFGPEDGLAQGDRLDRYHDNTIDNFAYLSGSWYRTNPPPTIALEPTPKVAEAFWFQMGGPRGWKRTFSVWP
jgi:outer membrane protein assembly factor BamB